MYHLGDVTQTVTLTRAEWQVLVARLERMRWVLGSKYLARSISERLALADGDLVTLPFNFGPDMDVIERAMREAKLV